MRYFPLIGRKDIPVAVDHGLDGLLEDFFTFPFKFKLGGFEKIPKVDVYEKGNMVTVKAEIPGVAPKDVKLSINGNILTLKGEKKEEKEIKKDDYYHLESSFGHFERSIELPWDVKEDAVKAMYRDGILKVELPKSESQRKKEIRIDT
ncbi:MAG: Hsp20/alpha crystallin family protein [Candidatus Omnitrophica bacterium]|nr:Hsp20/alpha crystallin family protein [Candidatus Omnitrophota bacterium]